MFDNQRDIGQACRDINQTSIDLLFTDVGLGQTFVGIAENSRNAATVRRNLDNARTAYDSVQKLRRGFALSAAEDTLLDSLLGELKRSLIAAGDVF